MDSSSTEPRAADADADAEPMQAAARNAPKRVSAKTRWSKIRANVRGEEAAVAELNRVKSITAKSRFVAAQALLAFSHQRAHRVLASACSSRHPACLSHSVVSVWFPSPPLTAPRRCRWARIRAEVFNEGDPSSRPRSHLCTILCNQMSLVILSVKCTGACGNDCSVYA